MTTALDSSFFVFFEFWIWTNHNSLQSIATNQLASFCIDIRSRHRYFRVCQSGEIWNKKAFFPYILIFLLHKTNRFHVAVRLFSNRSQRTSKCGMMTQIIHRIHERIFSVAKRCHFRSKVWTYLVSKDKGRDFANFFLSPSFKYSVINITAGIEIMKKRAALVDWTPKKKNTKTKKIRKCLKL